MQAAQRQTTVDPAKFAAFQEEVSSSFVFEREKLEASMQRLHECEVAMAAHKEQLQQLTSCLPVVDDGHVVLKHVSGTMLEELKLSEFSALGGPFTSGRDDQACRAGGSFVRCWQGKGRSDWKVVVAVTPSQRNTVLSDAKAIRRTGGVVVAPYLTVLGCALRRARQGKFDELPGKGLSPRWRKGVEIEYMESGGWMLYDFGHFGLCVGFRP
ncbi:hypothetical protein GPECTOR_232g529 [Gonium pectorale]|uniref:Uncharacterized protein n=1 Tax=Gonium pectorale TaxID=33097 RepID=A0A150FY71_GONPE|nr:hypothetical protein GPECTOR_232g529 [Gonium pectorale]|eukprot:KXZ41970.1 hypothetical protein GPECTOR_232g529 [Gonium pectorale]